MVPSAETVPVGSTVTSSDGAVRATADGARSRSSAAADAAPRAWRTSMGYLLERGSGDRVGKEGRERALNRYRSDAPKAVIITPLVASWHRPSWGRPRVVLVLSRFAARGSDAFAASAWSV